MEKTLKENRRFDTRTESKVGKKTKSRKDFEKNRRWKVGKKNKVQKKLGMQEKRVEIRRMAKQAHRQR